MHEVFCKECSNSNYYISNATCISTCPGGDYMEFTYNYKKFCELTCPFNLFEIEKESGKTCVTSCPTTDYYTIESPIKKC